ncbi:MAG: DEAD/DEAH box helicase family protein, partial [Atopostipes suicloacalis]|nr:DEAD/DEAH box helicase family protein [Atopostipes suicloacalis]
MIKDRIISSLKKGFIDESGEADEQVRSRFLTNDKEKNISVLETIKNELRTCNGFIFSIAFITESGLNELKSIFIDLNHKGISGKLITSDYLSFNSPKIFSELLKIKNLEVRITESEGFHSKGYLFQHEKHQTLIMGSSNLTSRALKINYEWNLKVSSLAEGELVNSVLNTIEHTWKNAKPLSKSWIDHYGRGYKNPILIKHKDFIEEPNSYETEEIVPNKMQESALKGIQDVRDKNEKRALVVSATGTGKTYLAAFDVKRFKAKKLLFIAHRDQILNQAIQDFKRVLGNPITD